MPPRNLILASLLALGLTACGDDGDITAPTAPAGNPTDTARPQGDQPTAGRIGHATGRIVSLGRDGNFLTIDHDEFEGDIAMGAMTMGFDIMGGVDLSRFSKGDEVAFRVKQGFDGTYRIMAICDTAAHGADCPAAKSGR